MTVYVCRDKDAACAEFLASERCANCPTLKNATTPQPADKWHKAVLHECMMIECAYVEADPAQTVKSLIDWHVLNERDHAAIEGAAKPAQPHDKTIDAIMDGIDREQTDRPEGLWETSTGAAHGKKMLAEIKALFATVTAQPEQPAQRNLTSGEQNVLHKALIKSGKVITATSAKPAPAEQGKRQPLTCVWTDQDDEYMPGTYASACGEMWSFTDGGVADNNVRFCQGCGKAVEVHGITPPQGNPS